MSFRRLLLKTVFLSSVDHNSPILSRLSSCSYFRCFSYNNKLHNSSSALLDTTKYGSGSRGKPFFEKSLLPTSAICVSQERFVHQGRARYSETSKAGPNEKKEETPVKMNVFQKFKAMYRDYWYVLVPVHVVTSSIFYGSFYYMARTGVDVAALAEWAHFGAETVGKIRDSGNSVTGHLAIAYLMYKVITPLRYTVTLGGTTVSINYLKKWGLIKPMPKRDELKKMFDEKKVELRKKRESLRERQELMKKTVMSKLPSKKRGLLLKGKERKKRNGKSISLYEENQRS